jgi:hypothetical protein
METAEVLEAGDAQQYARRGNSDQETDAIREVTVIKQTSGRRETSGWFPRLA